MVCSWCSASAVRSGRGSWTLPLASAAFAVALLGNGGWSLDAALGLTYADTLRWTWLGFVAIGVVVALGTKTIFAPKKAAA